jgi:hypothetical protein
MEWNRYIISVIAIAFLHALPAHIHAQQAASSSERPTANPGMPFVQKYCLSCHDAGKKKGNLDLGRFADEASLHSNRKIWANVITYIRNGEMPPRGAKQPSADERDAFVEAIRGAFRRADAGKPRDPGHVTIRRLNRLEYNNTIRDLCMIEFEPAENFPADEASHGFDNNGDALSLSPLLLERYLDAAEAVVARTLVTGEAPEPKVRIGFTQFITDGSKVPYRLLLFTSEPLVADFRLAADGDYLLRLEGKPTRKDLPPAQVSLRVDGQEVQRLTFAFPEKGGNPKVEVPLTLKKGKRLVSLTWLNPAPELEAKRASLPPRVDGQNKENHPGLELYRIDLVGPTNQPPEGHRRIMACDPRAGPREQARQILGRFASRAFRRPVAADEVERYLKLYDRTRAAGQDFQSAIGTALQAILVSPNFLFLVELDDRPSADGVRPISEYHLASRLSYFLWSSMPDEELLDLAARGELSKQLDAQVRRMLTDAKSDAFVQNFTPQWLGITGIEHVNRGYSFDGRMRQSLMRETLLFCDAVLRENRPITDFIDGRYTFLNERLARHYGLGQFAREKSSTVIPGHALVKVELPADGVRGGILTHASVLTMTSAPNRTSPVKRGMWILENLLASPPPPPPPNVPPLEEAADPKSKGNLSLRARLELHRGKAECAACHAKIDPLGFALEKFDVVGRYRESDGKGKIDDACELPDGRKFQGVEGLRQVLLERKDQFARCLTEKVLIYALGRGLEEYDIPTVDAIAAAVARDDYRFQTLILEVVKSDPFRLRRGTKGEKP